MNNIKHEVSSAIQNTATILTNYGYHFDMNCPYTLKGIEKLKCIEESNAKLILDSFFSYNSIIEEMPNSNETEVETNIRHLKKFLYKYKLGLSERFTSGIQGDFIIEIFAKNHHQIYRSVNFFGLSSYSLEALTFVPWDELFYRPESNSQKLFHLANTVMEQQLDVLTPVDCTHLLTELKTESRFKYNLEKIGYLYDLEANETMGYATAIKVTKAPTLKILH